MAAEDSRETRQSLLIKLRNPADVEAWGEFVALYGPLISSWCRKKGLQQADIDDASQNVLVRLATRIRTFAYDPSRGRFRSYLHTLVRYAVADLLQDCQDAGSGDSQILSALQSVAAPEELAATLDAAFDHELLGEALRRAEQRVDLHNWQAFQRTAFQGKPPADVAKELQITVASVYKAKSRILQILREEVAALESDEKSAHRVYSLLR